MEGMPYEKTFLVFINAGSNFSYISPANVEWCALKKDSHNESCLVQLATWMKIRIYHW